MTEESVPPATGRAEREGLFDALVDAPGLRAQVGIGLPVRPLEVDGVPRYPSRGVTVDQALGFSARGMRRFLLSFDVCCELTEERFHRIVTAERELLEDQSSFEGTEADLVLYGRRQGAVDHRLLAVVLARHVHEASRARR
ncbi:hypothetical protein [Blastococcus sp. LR1]|uniref:hypothetical protein n=1 Tax=Blastococcus sp. LR1 TaxID=2877000 RepID=UPI001CCA41D5|nr:hypothetical protein [Blastococcus sp. LR1]MCA0143348.1 hypothetical protein [Blastococcus sp. LR1]